MISNIICSLPFITSFYRIQVRITFWILGSEGHSMLQKVTLIKKKSHFTSHWSAATCRPTAVEQHPADLKGFSSALCLFWAEGPSLTFVSAELIIRETVMGLGLRVNGSHDFKISLDSFCRFRFPSVYLFQFKKHIISILSQISNQVLSSLVKINIKCLKQKQFYKSGS